jgi:DivIVA domain-containing protein
MGLTAKQVEEVVFSGSLRGYDRDEVDAFLDRVVATLRQLESELHQMRAERASALSRAATAEQGAADLDAAIGARIDAAVQRALAEADG